MTQALDDGSGEVSASYFFLADLPRLPEMVELADVLVICRARYDHRVNHLVNAFHGSGKRVLFDVDDLVFDVRYGHLVQRTLDQDLDDPRVWNDWFAYSSRIGMTLGLCDAAVTTNEYLAERIREFADLPVARGAELHEPRATRRLRADLRGAARAPGGRRRAHPSRLLQRLARATTATSPSSLRRSSRRSSRTTGCGWSSPATSSRGLCSPVSASAWSDTPSTTS